MSSLNSGLFMNLSMQESCATYWCESSPNAVMQHIGGILMCLLVSNSWIFLAVEGPSSSGIL